jgi:capsular exopolysaccharide synthesis family protein
VELRLFFDIIKRRALIIIIVAAATVAVALAARILIRPLYSAYATVRVLTDVGVADFRLSADYSSRLLSTYTSILKSRPILEKAISLQSPQTTLPFNEVRDQLEVAIVPNTELISIAVQNQDPAVAQSLANTLADLLTEYSQDVYASGGKSARQIVEEQMLSMETDLRSARQRYVSLQAADGTDAEAQVLAREIEFKEAAYNSLLIRYETVRLNESLRANSVTVISPAILPLEPSNRLGLTHFGLALIVGVFAGLGLALILENLDTRIHSPRQLELLTKLPVLGAVPNGLLSQNGSAPPQKPVVRRQMEEAYRLLGINLRALRSEQLFHAVLITSAMPREGKSTVATNLALVLAEGGQTVSLVESDVRRPSVGKILGLGNGRGLTDLLDESAPTPTEVSTVTHIVQPSGLAVILSGPRVPHPATLFASLTMETLLNSLSAKTDITVLDAPPVLGLADVSILAPRVDGVIIIVRESMTRREQLVAALKQVQASRGRVLGLVFVKKSGHEWAYGY